MTPVPAPADRPGATGARPSRRVFLGGALGLAGAGLAAAAGCGITEPRPDALLRAQLALANRDVLRMGGDAGARVEHARVLAAEIERACGTREDGTAPQSCVADPEAAADPAEGTGVRELLLDSLRSPLLPEALADGPLREDFPVLVAAAVTGGIVLAAREAEVAWAELTPLFEGADPGPADAGLLAGALAAEYQLIYGMGVAAPRVPARLAESTATSADRHRRVRDEVIRVLDAAGAEVPAAPAGYAPAGGADPDADPGDFAAELERAAARAWRGVLAEAHEPGVRFFALQAAGLAQAGAAVFAGEPTAAVPGLGDAAPAADG